MTRKQLNTKLNYKDIFIFFGLLCFFIKQLFLQLWDRKREIRKTKMKPHTGLASIQYFSILFLLTMNASRLVAADKRENDKINFHQGDLKFTIRTDIWMLYCPLTKLRYVRKNELILKVQFYLYVALSSAKVMKILFWQTFDAVGKSYGSLHLWNFAIFNQEVLINFFDMMWKVLGIPCVCIGLVFSFSAWKQSDFPSMRDNCIYSNQCYTLWDLLEPYFLP